MRNKPERATWLNGYQSKALFNNAEHTRKTVVSIFKESPPSPISRKVVAGWKRNDLTGAGDNV